MSLVDFLEDVLKNEPTFNTSSTILDIAAGTGLVGIELRQRGFVGQIDGHDGSAILLEVEKRKGGVYENQRWSRGHKARGQGQGHKKIRGQGQERPFRGQTQGHRRKCSPKKKSPKNISGDLKKKKRFSKSFFRRSTKF